ncbi:MAG: glycine-rich domain-containing protein, partial [Actinomycetota bacterium]
MVASPTNVNIASAAGETLVTPAATRIAPSTTNAAISDDFNIAGYAAGTTLLANVSFTSASPSNTTFSINTTTGLTLGYGYTTWNGVRDISFTGTQSAINTALDSLTVTTGSASGTAILSVSVTTSDANVYYFSQTGNFYRAVTGAVTYGTAEAATTSGANSTYKGRPGYMVTIMSQAEQDFVNSNVNVSNIWIGLYDTACEGQFRWATSSSPQSGQLAWQLNSLPGCSSTAQYPSTAGTTQSGMYANWCNGEPNNWSGVEDHTVTKWGGNNCWNDLQDTNSGSVGGYIIEYGDAQAFTDFLSSNMTIAVSSTPGLVASVTSDLLNGTYAKGQNVDVKVNFTDPVNVTGTPTLTLNATGNDNGAIATYLSGSGTSTLTFRYTVLEGQSASDLNYSATNSLALNGGTITLVSGGSNATLTLPATTANESLGGTKNIVISAGTSDLPSSSITAASLAAYATSTTISIPYTASDPSTTIRNVQAYYSTAVGLTSPVSCGTTTSAVSPNTITCALPATNTTYYLYTRATDAAGQVEAAPSVADDSVILDTTAPSVTFGGATSLALGASTSVTMNFGETVTGFDASDVSATFGTLTGFTGSGASFSATFTASGTLGGTAVITVAAATATDVAGNTNPVATRNITVATAPNSRTSFNSSGTNFIVERYTTATTSSWVAPRGVNAVDLLVVGGGGGAGSRGAGGGGAGGFVEANSYSVTAGSTYNVTVGAGGAGAPASTTNSGSAGSASSFLIGGVGLTANGGGGGNAHGSNSASGGNSGSGSGSNATAYQN